MVGELSVARFAQDELFILKHPTGCVRHVFAVLLAVIALFAGIYGMDNFPTALLVLGKLFTKDRAELTNHLVVGHRQAARNGIDSPVVVFLEIAGR